MGENLQFTRALLSCRPHTTRLDPTSFSEGIQDVNKYRGTRTAEPTTGEDAA